jgi:hypothetical protein
VAAVAAVGAGGYAFHEHHEKKKDHKDAEQGQRREEAPPPLRLTVPYWPAIELAPARPAQRRTPSRHHHYTTNRPLATNGLQQKF